MEEAKIAAKPHVVCVPLPLQGHMNPMLTLSKLLHLHGFHVTFVLTHFNFSLLLNSRGPHSVKGLPGFRLEAISDGLPPESKRGILDLPEFCVSTPVEGLRSFRELIGKLQQGASPDVPPVSCIVSDGVMGFTMKAAEEFSIPEFVLFTPSGCGMLGYLNFDELEKRGYFPLKGKKSLSSINLNFSSMDGSFSRSRETAVDGIHMNSTHSTLGDLRLSRISFVSFIYCLIWIWMEPLIPCFSSTLAIELGKYIESV